MKRCFVLLLSAYIFFILKSIRFCWLHKYKLPRSDPNPDLILFSQEITEIMEQCGLGELFKIDWVRSGIES